MSRDLKPRDRQSPRRRPAATVVISWHAVHRDPTVMALDRFEDEDRVFMDRRSERRERASRVGAE